MNINNPKIILKGFMHGVKKLEAYKNPDIFHSIVDDHECQMNNVKIIYLSEKKQFYIYHSYDQTETKYSGRWYIGNYSFNPKDLNAGKKTFSITLKSVDWEDFDTVNTVIKDVDIIIYFTDYGFRKINKFFAKINNK